MASIKKTFGILASFKDPGSLLKAASKVRDAGYTKFDCHSSFPIHGMDQAMGQKKSVLGWIVAAAGFAGAGGAMLMQWWMSSIDYPLVISGKPFFSLPAFVPITFELGVLFSAFAAVIGMLALNRLPQLSHPLFNSEQFKKVTDDGFFVSVEACDPKYDTVETKKFLLSVGGIQVEVIEDE